VGINPSEAHIPVIMEKDKMVAKTVAMRALGRPVRASNSYWQSTRLEFSRKSTIRNSQTNIQSLETRQPLVNPFPSTGDDVRLVLCGHFVSQCGGPD